MSQMAVPNIRVKKPKNRHRERFVQPKIVHDGEFLAKCPGSLAQTFVDVPRPTRGFPAFLALFPGQPGTLRLSSRSRPDEYAIVSGRTWGWIAL